MVVPLGSSLLTELVALVVLLLNTRVQLQQFNITSTWTVQSEILIWANFGWWSCQSVISS